MAICWLSCNERIPVCVDIILAYTGNRHTQCTLDTTLACKLTDAFCFQLTTVLDQPKAEKTHEEKIGKDERKKQTGCFGRTETCDKY